MKTFPTNSPRKKIEIRINIIKEGDKVITTTGVEVTPFVIHLKWDSKKDAPEKKGLWSVTHLFTGKGLGISGSYKFCKAVAEGVMDEPLVWLPCESMWENNPDVGRVGAKLQRLKEKHEHLGRWW